jgi:hypothetical protein
MRRRALHGPVRCAALAVALALLCLGAFAAQAPKLTPAEYEVLSAVLAHGLPGDTRAIAISARTTGDPETLVPAGADLEALSTKLEVAPGLLAGWSGLNRQRGEVERNLALAVRYDLVPDKLRARIFAGEEPARGWARFRARFPDATGLLSVSRVAIDDSQQHALVYVEFACGPECGTGRLVHLARADGRWQVISGELLWVAGS